MGDKINVGEFEFSIILKFPKQTVGGKGQVANTWESKAPVYAKVEEVVSDESIDNHNLISEEIIEVTMYRYAAMTNRWRLEHQGEDYDIIKIQPIGRSPYCKVKARKVAD